MRRIMTLGFVVMSLHPAIAKTPASRAANWEKKTTDLIKTELYQFNKGALKAQFNAKNSKNDFTCIITENGYSIKHMITAEPDPWSVSFNLTEIGGIKSRLQNVELAGANKLLYHYKNATVRYKNSDLGLRQDFIVDQKSDHQANLKVDIDVVSGLIPKVNAENQLVLTARNGHTKLVYDDLHVWDATHRVLPASFSIRGNHVSINVDDKNAVYPVTIDPLTRTPEWNTSSSGLLSGILSGQVNSSLYGFTVVSVGDVNGDGFGDVAVGAPALSSLLSGSSVAKVGAVYIFHGSATGFLTTPAAILQPTTAVAGALFGFSIAGGDVDGDGFSDVIVGAPLDQITANIGLGPTTVSLGKVYYFSGSSLNSNSNPAPVLSLNISNGNLDLTSLSVKSLFGFSVAITDDLNADGKKDIIVGSPGFRAGGVKAGGAYVFNSTVSGGTLTGYNAGTALNAPTLEPLGLGLPISIDQLLFGYSVDGVGDYNADGKMDVVVGAPGGDGISGILGVIANGQILSGRAVVYFGNGTGVNPNPGTQLYSGPSGLLNNIGNLLGFSVKGLRNNDGTHNGSIAVGAPLAGTLSNALALTIKTGSVHIFKPKSSPAAFEAPFQILESPGSTTILNLLSSYNLNALMGASIDNMYDANGDTYPDIIIGEPLSTGTNILNLQASLTGGHAYVYAGNASGGFDAAPIFTVNATYGGAFASVNAVPLFGYSVAGVRNARGINTQSRVVVGSPAASLDFGSGLLNIGGTVNTLLNFTTGNDGPGSAYSFDPLNNVALPIHLLSFNGTKKDLENTLTWKVAANREIQSFELERSANGKTWSLLEKVTAQNTSVATTYVQNDASPLSGKNYYRLKIIYGGEKADYSQVVVLAGDNKLADDVSIYPNPVTDVIRISTSDAGEETIRVMDARGAVTMTKKVTGDLQSGQSFNKSDLGMSLPGIYTIEIIRANGTSTKKKIFVQ